jgi:hypothetical protein
MTDPKDVTSRESYIIAQALYERASQADRRTAHIGCGRRESDPARTIRQRVGDPNEV